MSSDAAIRISGGSTSHGTASQVRPRSAAAAVRARGDTSRRKPAAAAAPAQIPPSTASSAITISAHTEPPISVDTRSLASDQPGAGIHAICARCTQPKTVTGVTTTATPATVTSHLPSSSGRGTPPGPPSAPRRALRHRPISVTACAGTSSKPNNWT